MNEKSYNLFFRISLWILIIISVLIIYWAYNTYFAYQDITKYSHFGQFIGGIIGPVWSLISILLFYKALRYQSQDLKNQRSEYQYQRFENQFNFYKSKYENTKYKKVYTINNKNYEGDIVSRLIIDKINSIKNNHFQYTGLNILDFNYSQIIQFCKNQIIEKLSEEENLYINHQLLIIEKLTKFVLDDNTIDSNKDIYYDKIKDSIDDIDFKLIAINSFIDNREERFRIIFKTLNLSAIFSPIEDKIMDAIDEYYCNSNSSSININVVSSYKSSSGKGLIINLIT